MKWSRIFRSVLNDAGTELKGAVSQATMNLTLPSNLLFKNKINRFRSVFTQFDHAQTKFNEILTTFSVDMNGYLDRMATELAAVGDNAENMINFASENLQKYIRRY